MGEAMQPAEVVTLKPKRMSPLRLILRIMLWSSVAVAIGVCAYSLRLMLEATTAKNAMPEGVTRAMGLIAPVPKKLSSEFVDSKARLLADPPTAADQLLDPPTLVVAHFNSADADNPAVPWLDFENYLSQATGKPVEDAAFENSPADLADIKSGKTTLVALHAVEAPFLVNHYGFQPAAVLGDDSGANGNHVNIIVPAGSPIASAADLRGRSLVCTVPSSITGYRAAVALLMSNESLRPNVDYAITWSLGQKKSINGVIKKTFPAAAVSDDKLQGLVRKGKVQATDYHTIYSSPVIPRTTIGWFYNLKPELAEKIRGAILSYRPDSKSGGGDKSTSQADDTAEPADMPAKALHFLPIDYKKDFQLVRQIDDSFDPRLGVKAKTPKTQTATTKP